MLGFFAAGLAQAQPAPQKIHFDRDIQPLFAKRCFSCHGPDKAQAGLRLNVKESALGTLESGAAGDRAGPAGSQRGAPPHYFDR